MTEKINDYDIEIIRPGKKVFRRIDEYFRLIDEAYSRIGVKAGVFKPPARRVHDKQEILDTISNGWIIGVFDNELLIGTVSVVPGEKTESDIVVAKIHLMAVSTRMEGRGLGKKIILYAENFLKQKYSQIPIRVEIEAVEEHRLPLFYAKCGYTVFDKEDKLTGEWGSCKDFHIIKMCKRIQ